jgi:hypothetical protein
VSYFSFLGWQDFHSSDLIWSGLSDFWYLFYNKSKKHYCIGVYLYIANIWRKHFSRNTILLRIFSLKRFFSCYLQKSWVRSGPMKIGWRSRTNPMQTFLSSSALKQYVDLHVRTTLCVIRHCHSPKKWALLSISKQIVAPYCTVSIR